MSIIYEALRKVESRKDLSGLKDSAKRPPLAIEEEQSKTPQEAKKFFLPLITVVILIGLFFLSLKGIDLFYSDSQPKASVKFKPIEKQQLSKKDKISSGSYSLEGIVHDGSNSLAIINGKVFRNYDRIDDYLIMDIDKNEVELVNIHDKTHLDLSLSY
ncbi:MAG: hypothetical protein KBB01_00445 [Candidatus Omnitrophica bacterium]|jgi:hypothetical protein|nr:hypothetical protein [Candidatus Omnitrophota bacterium]